MEDPSAVLETAIANEMEGHRILQRGREAATEPLAKATFEFLANEELKHIEIIRDFAKTLDGVTPWDESVLKGGSLSDAFKHVRSIFERFGAQFEAVSASDHERLEIYEVAMDMERRGYEFYSRAAQQASDERARRLFSFLAGEEQRHFQMIQDTHDFLQEPDALLAMEERWMQI
jgi:rubrerythrin